METDAISLAEQTWLALKDMEPEERLCFLDGLCSVFCPHCGYSDCLGHCNNDE